MCWLNKMTSPKPTFQLAAIPPLVASNPVPQSTCDCSKKLDEVLANQQQILGLLKSSDFKPNGDGPARAALKREIRDFMLAHFNIKAIDDKVEAEIYDTAIDVMCDICSKYVPFL